MTAVFAVWRGEERPHPAFWLPLMAPLAFIRIPSSFSGIKLPAWAGLAYISVLSSFIGFIFWNRGLAKGGIATIGQLQLLQPLLGLGLAATLLNEKVNTGMIGITIGVILCVLGSRRFGR